ncbi:hypothetical protein PVAND_014539 [Polypedilum vanderplanki]|uniref:Uncharacterized protein n=1 Tax=Polypedilum vanderplanki TaxID=319348 RepID=A0A9J6BA77_POLVA|nr:hypothetical protein PVAND_014539 [Polypedilum vanderplanki]
MENVKLTRMTAYIMEYIYHDLIPTGIPKFLIDYGSWLLKRPFHVEIKDSIRVLSMTDLEFGKVRRTIEKLEIFTIAKLVEIILEIMMKNFNGRL